MGTLKQVAFWIVFAVGLAPVWGTLLWELWDGSVRPRLVPSDFIERAAAAVLARHGDRAEQMAWMAEDRAWRYSDSFRQGCWRRVRKRIMEMRREADAGARSPQHTPPSS
jgi:hypothetical protein